MEPKSRNLSTSRPARASTPARTSVTIAGIPITNPSRILDPESGLTKEDLARHYALVAPLLLAHAGGRPLMVLRCPSGRVTGPDTAPTPDTPPTLDAVTASPPDKCFVQRRAGKGIPAAVGSIDVLDDGKGKMESHKTESHKMESHLMVSDAAGLVALAQIGALEVHAWGCFPDDPESPDRITFDLDPGPGTTWGDLVKGARELKKRLEARGLIPFVKTSGGRGIHVVVPLSRGTTWDAAESFSRELAAELADEYPDRYVATMAKARRENRIFIDYLRNARAASVVVPWSPRARPGAPVSVPVTWDELARVRPDRFTVKTTPRRLKKPDPWASFETSRGSLP